MIQTSKAHSRKYMDKQCNDCVLIPEYMNVIRYAWHNDGLMMGTKYVILNNGFFLKHIISSRIV